MIVGIGTDLCKVGRIRQSLRRFGVSFAQTYCSAREIHYATSRPDPAILFAQYFAAKEAFAKAAGTGFSSDLWWDDVETAIDDDWRVRLLVSADAICLLRTRLDAPDGISVHVSTCANPTICSAFVVIERRCAESEFGK
jgi:holo-[acyl-carrier protein] synthase